MRPREVPLHPDDGTEAAIAKVLSAEREAQAAIDAARREAGERAAAARQAVRRIAERAEARILSARRAVEQRIARREAEVRAAVAALQPDESLEGEDFARLGEAVRDLARELTGGAP